MTGRLKESVVNRFTAGEMGFVIMMSLAVNYYPYFMTDVVRLNAALAGTVLLVARIVDAVSVPVAGGFVEKANPNWGKYRSWLLLAPPVTAVFFILMFSDPGLSPMAKAVYFGLVYILGHISVNLAGSAYFALIPVLAGSAADRVRLSCRRAQAMSAGQIIFGVVAMPLIIYLGAGNEGRGFLLTIIVFSVLQVAGYLLAAQAARPYDSPGTGGGPGPAGVKDMVGQIVGNRPLMVLILAEVLRWSVVFVLMSFALYYFKYVADNMILVSVFFTSLSVAALAGSSVGQYLAQRLTQKNTWAVGMALAFAAMTAARFFAGDAMLFILFCALAAAGNSIVFTLSGALFADVSDYTEWKTGKNAKGIIMALSALPIKIAVAMSGAIVGFSLAAIGYVSDIDASSALAASISTAVTMVPALFALLSIIAIRYYPLTEHKVAQMQEEICKRQVPPMH